MNFNKRYNQFCVPFQLHQVKTKPGRIDSDVHAIDTRPGTDIREKQYPVPLKLVKQVKEELLSLEKEGIIRKSIKGSASPAFAVMKRTGLP